MGMTKKGGPAIRRRTLRRQLTSIPHSKGMCGQSLKWKQGQRTPWSDKKGHIEVRYSMHINKHPARLHFVHGRLWYGQGIRVRPSTGFHHTEKWGSTGTRRGAHQR
ncbi:hypothetical protein B0H12DRAFT_1093175 [Mycena haematopus]|nr:hypothetical protein B0H12DRAFT_1093175 [Mycena haematopus]